MIIVKLIGGLGNQMFQYAAGRQLSLLHQTGLLFDTSYLEKDPKGAYTKRDVELTVFNINVKKATLKDIEPFRIEQSSKISRELQRRFPFLFTYLYVAESGHHYQQQFLKFPKNTYLEGFWQSEKYFVSIQDVIRKDFTFAQPLNTENIKWLQIIDANNSVSLHIRRGDYISNQMVQQHHGSLPLGYYQNAIEYIKLKYPNPEIFVFSDDLDWCKTNLKLTDKIHYVDANQHDNFHLDMYLMSQCKHNIIANSSFSWWAAWLNQNPQKIIVAPKNWFSNKTLHTKDLIPQSWITL